MFRGGRLQLVVRKGSAAHLALRAVRSVVRLMAANAVAARLRENHAEGLMKTRFENFECRGIVQNRPRPAPARPITHNTSAVCYLAGQLARISHVG